MRLLMKFKSLVAIVLSLIVCQASMFAEVIPERWFQVEVMIFKNPQLETDNPEVWPSFSVVKHPSEYIALQGISEILTANSETEDEEGSKTPDSAVELEAPTSEKGLEAFVALSEFERLMTEQREKIDSNSRYELLFHEAWVQPVPGRADVIPIRIDAGERFGRQSELQGYINLYVERYLHFSTDLHLIEYKKSNDPFSLIAEDTSTENTSAILKPFGGLSLLNADSMSNSQITRKSNQFYVSVQDALLQEKRKMRSKEIHYLDNPEFGLLILITPIELPETTE